MYVPFVDLAAQTRELEDELRTTALAALDRTDWILGADVDAFEDEFAEYCGAAHAIGVDSGTSAIELALRALGIGPGDEVITAANTFIATAFAISHTGASVRLVDVDLDTSTMNPDLLEQAITPRTRAIVPVHLYGQPADMDAVLAVAADRGLAVIEDACQAHGAEYRSRRAGSLGRAAAFSFYPSKNLGAMGDGGIVVTDDPSVRDSVRMLRNYGQQQKYRHEMVAFNRRLDTLQAALLRVKLRRLDAWNEARRAHAALYMDLLADTDLVLPDVRADVEHVWHLFVVRTPVRDALQEFLAERGVAAGVHYPIPVHLQPAYEGLGYERGSFPVSEFLADEILSLPMYPQLDTERIEFVANCLHEFASTQPTPVEEPVAP